MNEQMIPQMLMGRELEEAMLSLPPYDSEICHADAAARLMQLNDITEIYIPSTMSFEIYSKIYLAMLHSLKKKQTTEAVRQGNQNHRRLQGLSYNSVLGGADSFSIIGPSGIGKSTALAKSIALSGGGQIITTNNPYAQIIPCVNVQCPHDCSVKGLLLEILSQVDIAIGTNYEHLAVKNRASIDNLIGTVSQVALNNILLIVIYKQPEMAVKSVSKTPYAYFTNIYIYKELLQTEGRPYNGKNSRLCKGEQQGTEPGSAACCFEKICSRGNDCY